METNTGSLDELINELQAKVLADATVPKKLLVSSIKEYPNIFQPRHPEINQKHRSDLANTLKRKGKGGELDPIIVLMTTEGAVVVEGHHRLEAYRSLARKTIPAKLFKGTVKQAILAAGAVNSRVKLEMSHEERLNYAWKLVKIEGFTKGEISLAAGVAERTVTNMRKIKSRLGEEAFGIASWWKALNTEPGKGGSEMTEEQLELWLQDQAQKHADKIAKACGTKLAEHLEIAKRALEIYFGARIGELAEELSEFIGGEGREESDHNDF